MRWPRVAMGCCAALVALGLSGGLRAQSLASYRVGTAEATRGQKAFGFLEVPKGVDAATNIPVVVVNGAKPGPVLALVSGAHGTEYASIIALERVIATLEPAELTGTVVILPLVNTASFEQKVPHLNPTDGKNMNRFYPGKADGTRGLRDYERGGGPLRLPD
jgi:predicted deacylase